VRERDVRLVLDNEGQHASRWQAVMSIAAKIGCTPQTLNDWVKRAEVDSGQRAGIPTELAEKMKALERENRELTWVGFLGMKIPSSMPRLKGFRYPREIVAYAVWAYHRFALSTADVEDLMAERSVIVSREAIRLWVKRFGAHFAGCIRRDRLRPNDKLHLDEAVIRINGVKHWLWRAVGANGDTLDILVQTRRNAKAAKRFLTKLIAQSGQPGVVITDKLRSYIKPICNLTPNADHRAHKGLNNRIEGSHRPTRRREKIVGRFKSQRQAQRFLVAHDQINTIFKLRRYRLTAASFRHARADAFGIWADYAIEMAA